MGDPGHVWRDPNQDLLTGAKLGGERLQAVELVERVQHDVANADLERLAQLAAGLGVSVQVGPRGVKAAGQGQRQLAARGDVARQPVLREHPVHGRAGERLGREEHVEVVVARGHGVDERARARPQILLHHGVGRGSELPRELERVAAPELEVTALVDPRAERQQMREAVWRCRCPRAGERYGPGAVRERPEVP